MFDTGISSVNRKRNIYEKEEKNLNIMLMGTDSIVIRKDNVLVMSFILYF